MFRVAMMYSYDRRKHCLVISNGFKKLISEIVELGLIDVFSL